MHSNRHCAVIEVSSCEPNARSPRPVINIGHSRAVFEAVRPRHAFINQFIRVRATRNAIVTAATEKSDFCWIVSDSIGVSDTRMVVLNERTAAYNAAEATSLSHTPFNVCRYVA